MVVVPVQDDDVTDTHTFVFAKDNCWNHKVLASGKPYVIPHPVANVDNFAGR